MEWIMPYKKILYLLAVMTREYLCYIEWTIKRIVIKTRITNYLQYNSYIWFLVELYRIFSYRILFCQILPKSLVSGIFKNRISSIRLLLDIRSDIRIWPQNQYMETCLDVCMDMPIAHCPCPIGDTKLLQSSQKNHFWIFSYFLLERRKCCGKF